MADTALPSKRTFTGSCHCGFVRYEAALSSPSPPGPHVASRCNCTICLKTGYTGFHLAPDDFTLRSPASFDELSDYQFRSKDIHRYFCKTCGVQVCSSGKYEYGGTVVDFFGINILTLDQPQEGLDLSQWKIVYYDGRNDNWMEGTKDVPWPGGCI
jgi:hypothetical protein